MSTAKIDKTYMALNGRFPLVPLREKAHFEEAVQVMKELAYRQSELCVAEADYLSVLGGLIAQYEERLPSLASEMTPREALIYLMEVNQLSQSELVPLVGHKSNLSAFLNGRRGLSKQAASQLAAYFKVSPALFLPKD